MNLGIGVFPNRPKPYVIAATDNSFFCGKNDKTFTKDIDEAYFMSTPEEAEKNLIALRTLIEEEKEKEMAKLKEKSIETAEATPDVAPKVIDLSATVGSAVLEAMGGRPKSFYKIITKNVYGNRYRVNVYCEKEVAGSLGTVKQLAHSFFVTYDGGIKASVPAIVPNG
jgi:hypothetical protein